MRQIPLYKCSQNIQLLQRQHFMPFYYHSVSSVTSCDYNCCCCGYSGDIHLLCHNSLDSCYGYGHLCGVLLSIREAGVFPDYPLSHSWAYQVYLKNTLHLLAYTRFPQFNETKTAVEPLFSSHRNRSA